MTNDDRLRPATLTAPQAWDRLATYLADHGLEFDPGVEPRQFAGGLANQNYLVTVNGRPAVLRRPPPGPMAEGANDMAREWRVLSHLADAYTLAPRGLHFCADPDVLGAPFQLIEYRDGHGIGATLPPSVAARPGAGGELTEALVEAMAGLHALDPAAIGLGELGRPVGFLHRQVEGWGRRAAAAYPDGTPPEVGTIVDWLRTTVPQASGAALLHNDFKFDNMLFDLDRLEPVAVVDWDMATLGEPLFDLAVLLSYWSHPEDPPEVRDVAQVPSLTPGFPRRAEVAARYLAAAGRPPEDLSFLLVLARFRLAIVWAQLFGLWQRGASTDPRAGGFDRIARGLLAWTAATLDAPPL
jgi:aminoglycoside phosphotransferase (APT) family kinase protein